MTRRESSNLERWTGEQEARFVSGLGTHMEQLAGDPHWARKCVSGYRKSFDAGERIWLYAERVQIEEALIAREEALGLR